MFIADSYTNCSNFNTYTHFILPCSLPSVNFGEFTLRVPTYVPSACVRAQCARVCILDWPAAARLCRNILDLNARVH